MIAFSFNACYFFFLNLNLVNFLSKSVNLVNCKIYDIHSSGHVLSGEESIEIWGEISRPYLGRISCSRYGYPKK